MENVEDWQRKSELTTVDITKATHGWYLKKRRRKGKKDKRLRGEGRRREQLGVS